MICLLRHFALLIYDGIRVKIYFIYISSLFQVLITTSSYTLNSSYSTASNCN